MEPENNNNYRGQRAADVVTIITVVISVLAILLVLWFIANRVIQMTAKPKDDVTVASIEEVSSSEEIASSSSSVSEESVSSSSEEKPAVEVLVEGDAEFSNPDTWIGKTFDVNEGANVRAGAGTGYEVIQGVSPGDVVFVEQAEYVDDATWVYGTITEASGETHKGWIYSYTLVNVPIE